VHEAAAARRRLHVSHARAIRKAIGLRQEEKASLEEKVAKPALNRLPDKPYDPWKTMR
jgi:hypothetical protein